MYLSCLFPNWHLSSSLLGILHLFLFTPSDHCLRQTWSSLISFWQGEFWDADISGLFANTLDSCIPLTSSHAIQVQVPPCCCNFCFFLELEVKKITCWWSILKHLSVLDTPNHVTLWNWDSASQSAIEKAARCDFSKDPCSKAHLEWKTLWALQRTGRVCSLRFYSLSWRTVCPYTWDPRASYSRLSRGVFPSEDKQLGLARALPLLLLVWG